MPAGSTYSTIATTTLGSAQSSVTFNSFSGYTDLVLVVNAASDSVHAFINMQFNNDTGTNYSYTELLGTGSAASSSRYTNATQVFNSNVAMQQTTISYNGIFQIMNYANTTTNKTALYRGNNTGSDYQGTIACVGLWRNTAAITSIKLFPSRSGTAYNFSTGSTFTLYGIAAA